MAAEVARFRRDRQITRHLGRVLSLGSLGFLAWLAWLMMVERRLDVGCLILQGLAILSGVTRVVLSYWDQVPALVDTLVHGQPAARAVARSAWDALEAAPADAPESRPGGRPGDRLWELAPTGRRGDRFSADEAVALVVASRRIDWRRVAPRWGLAYAVVLVAGLVWFVTYQPGPDF